MRWLAFEISVPAVLLVVWWFASAGSTSIFFPPLRTIAEAFGDNWLFTRVGSDLVPSLLRLAAGFSLAALVGVTAGLVLGRSPMLARAVRPLLEFFRFIPPPVTAPIFIVLWGIGDTTKVLFIAFGVVWPVLMNSMDGARGVDRVQLDVTRVFGFSPWYRLWHLILKASAPRIFVGLRNGLAVGIIVMAVGEMLGSTNGVGYYVLFAQRTFAIPEMWAGMFMLGIVGYVLNVAFLAVERRALFWHRGAAPRATRKTTRKVATP